MLFYTKSVACQTNLKLIMIRFLFYQIIYKENSSELLMESIIIYRNYLKAAEEQ